jgi:hypothetical protein
MGVVKNIDNKNSDKNFIGNEKKKRISTISYNYNYNLNIART